MYIVFLRSDLGYEEFERDTLSEALETIKNITTTAESLNDGWEREIGILLNGSTE
jgi:hypothetical protein